MDLLNLFLQDSGVTNVSYLVLDQKVKEAIDNQIFQAQQLVRQVRNAASVDVGTVRRVAENLNVHGAQITARLASVDTAAFIAYVRAASGNPNYDPVAEAQSARGAMDTLKQWIDNNVPRAPGSNALEDQTWTLAGGFQQITLTTGQRNAFNTQADLFLSTVG
jgi:hypothetical protein